MKKVLLSILVMSLLSTTACTGGLGFDEYFPSADITESESQTDIQGETEYTPQFDEDETDSEDFKSGESLVVVDDKIIQTSESGVYYKENIDSNTEALALTSNASSLLTDGHIVYYVTRDDTTSMGMETFGMPHSIRSANIDDRTQNQVFENNNPMSLLCYYDGYIYYSELTGYNEGSINRIDENGNSEKLYDLSSDFLGCIGNKLYFANKDFLENEYGNALVSYNLTTDEIDVEIDGIVIEYISKESQYEDMLYFSASPDGETYKNIYTIDTQNNITKSAQLAEYMDLQIVDSDGEYALCFDDNDEIFDMYKVDLRTGEVQIAADEAGRYKNKNYFVTYDRDDEDDIYFGYNIGLYDEDINKIVEVEHDEFEIDIMKPTWIIDGKIMDSNLNTYEIYD